MALSWAIPLVVCSLCVLSGGARKYSEFCWIDSKEEMYAYAGIRLVIIAIAIGISMALFQKVKKLNGNSVLKLTIFFPKFNSQLSFFLWNTILNRIGHISIYFECNSN